MAEEQGTGKYIEGIGRRKTSVARVRIWEGKKDPAVVNGKPLEEYFQSSHLQKVALEPMAKYQGHSAFGISVVTKGGGIESQAEAVRHGIARALVKSDETIRALFKGFGFLTRDPRMRERKKFGLKRARRARQWRKR